MTIDEFLSARLDELEAEAADIHGRECESIAYDYGGIALGPCDCGWPARVLADVATKRKIIADYQAAQANPRPFNSVMARAAALHHVMTYLVQPFSEYPDFSPEWKTP